MARPYAARQDGAETALCVAPETDATRGLPPGCVFYPKALPCEAPTLCLSRVH